MPDGTEDFEKLRKLLKVKRYEQPPPGYFSRFSTVVINRIEREAQPDGTLVEAPWLKKLLRMFESSPVVGGLFGSGLCALVIFGIAMANQGDKAPRSAFMPVASSDTTSDGNGIVASASRVSASSTDALFGSNITGSPFTGNGSLTAVVEPVNFTQPAPQ